MIIQLSLERGNDVEGRDMSSWLQFGCGTCAMSWLIRVPVPVRARPGEPADHSPITPFFLSSMRCVVGRVAE